MDTDRLSSVPLFAALDEEQRARVASKASVKTYEIGRVLTEEQDLSSQFFVILQGRVAVTTSGGFVAVLGPGDMVGEMGALRRAQRTANAVAITEVQALSMMAWDLRELAEEIPLLADGVESTMAQRLAEMEPGLPT